MDKLTVVFFSLFIVTPCWADMPLTIEDLLTRKNKFRLDFRLSYANADRNNVDTRFELVQVGTSSFILLPVNVSNQRQNSEILTLTLGIRYGITTKTEFYSRLTAFRNNVRIQRGVQTASHSSQQWNALVLGINHQFSTDNETPALLSFADVSAVENTAINASNFVYGKTAQIGLTTYRSIDPVVLSLTIGYRYAGKRVVDKQNIDPGDLLFINPNIGIAMNSEITLTGGVQFKFLGKDEVQGTGNGIYTSQTDLDFGLGYAYSQNLTASFKIRSNISSDGGAQADLSLLYTPKG